MKKIILVDDSKEIFSLVEQAVVPLGELTWSQNFVTACLQLNSNIYDLALIDLELPDGNGFDLCTVMQKIQPLTPIFIITSHSNLSEKVMGFTAGADDYIVKPFEVLELRARVDGRLKKVDYLKDCSSYLKWNELQINKRSQEVLVLDGDDYTPVILTSLEFKLLMFFASHASEVVSRDEILHEIWGENVYVYPRSVDTHVSKLRKKLNSVSHVIESVHGVGYKFTPTAS
jgi:DNA-binding response OmpR family regulator